MIDLERIEGFDWDDGNARKNERHGVTQAEAERTFFDQRFLPAPGPRHSAGGPRLHALGPLTRAVCSTLRSHCASPSPEFA